MERKRHAAARRIIQAMAHPVRIQILNILGERVASPNQIAEISGEPLGTVAYHVRVLLKGDFIELARTEPRRGATEHFYRSNPDALGAGTFEKRDGSGLACVPLQVDEEGWKEILAIVVKSEQGIRNKQRPQRFARNSSLAT